MANTQQDTEVKLAFGLRDYPPTVKAVWGARLIFDGMQLLGDRQDFAGMDTEDGRKLKHWLNQEGNLARAISAARRMAKRCEIQEHEYRTVVLHENHLAVVKGNPQSSYGYLYVCAYLKQHVTCESCGLGRDDVQQLAREQGLDTATQPAWCCEVAGL